MATTTITSRCSRCNRRDSKDVCGRCQYDIEIGDLRKGELFSFFVLYHFSHEIIDLKENLNSIDLDDQLQGFSVVLF